jgi:hypothetical protein
VVPFSTIGVVDTGVEVGGSGLNAGLGEVGDAGDAAGGGSVGGMTETGAGATGGGREAVTGAAAGGAVPAEASSRSLMCFSATARLGAVGASFRKRR